MSPPSLWSPVRIRALSLPHRLTMAAMGTGFASNEGAVTDRLVHYLARRAEGGVALVTTEAASVDPSGTPFPPALAVDHDGRIDGLRRLTAAVHARGARISMQIYHAGRQMSRRVSGRQPVAPSAVPCPLVREMPRALAADEVAALVDRFGAAAARARESGFDAVEIHGAHGYLIHQFLTPLANRREDDWGGDLRGRARFALDVVRQVRERVGPHFPIFFKLSAEDHLPGGLTIDDTLAVGRWLGESGVDALVVSAGTYASFDWIVQPITRPRGCLREYAARFRAGTGLPIVAVGRINDPRLADEIVTRGDADLVQMGRALLADPDLPRKARSGTPIRPCITCNDCLADLMRASPIHCAVNPEMGRETGLPAPAASTRRRVAVVGGGPAGMQAALVARERGHDVTLIEASGALGGRLELADRPRYKREVGAFRAYLARRVAEAGVTIRLGARASLEDLRRLAADAVIAATGARLTYPAIEGARAPLVMTAEQCLASAPPAGGHAVVVGGGSTACEVACHLRELGWDVTLLVPRADLARDLESVTRHAVAGEVARLGVRVRRDARVEKIGDGVVRHADASGASTAESAALVVLADAHVAPDDSWRELAGPWSLDAVGDSAEPGDLGAAIRSATDAASRLG
jgi:2,4-dienoyl-CoA reductase-like NADH-dependent reductase (Old Yellow Enzyme family)/thioredoxin reductase